MPVDHEQFSNLRVFEHPLVHDKLSRARNAATQPAQFRRLLNEIAGLMTYEVCRELKTARTTVRTPMGETSGLILDEPVTLVPILRAGIGMTDGILALLPEARVGHIGLYRDENTLEPVEYYAKMPPDVTEGVVLLVDPLLATGGSASAAVTL
ncbi:MAG: uracil phosphoribosyltransferase, partial [Planctomycetota bacterium]|nr:uracil phosphoribosyltransferase [Planctomycetota bacterium]